MAYVIISEVIKESMLLFWRKRFVKALGSNKGIIARTIIILVLGALLACALVWRESGPVFFEGKVTDFGLACGADGGPCTATVDNKKVIVSCGLQVDTTNCPSANTADPVWIGDYAKVKATKVEDDLYSVTCSGCFLSKQ